MSPAVREFHGRRFRRMLADLQLEAGALTSGPGFALLDDMSRRTLTPPLRNQTLCEGLVSAVKLAAAANPEFVP